jgi:hypothetical protein
MKTFLLAAAVVATGCTVGEVDECYDAADNLVACEDTGDVEELPEREEIIFAEVPDDPADWLPGPDDLDGPADEAVDVALADDPETAAEATLLLAAGGAMTGGRTDVTVGRTNTPELFKLLPIGRTAGTRRYVVMRIKPGEVPNLAVGDVVRAAAEIQVTTACDIGQTGPMCGYTPKVHLQLVLAGDGDATDPHRPGVVALSKIKEFSCNADDHHCVKTIDFGEASLQLTAGNAPPCVASQSCFVNLVIWANDPQARGSGKDKLIVGANEGNFLANGKSEQDRGRVMLVRERGIVPADKVLRATKHNVKSGNITFGSNGDRHRVYSHTLKGGQDLVKGEKFRVWAELNATSDHRVNVDTLFFLTKNRNDKNGGSVNGANPGSISEHNGTNCSPGNPCNLRKVALFEVNENVKGPVFVNLSSSAEVPGPGFANVVVHDNGFIKSVRYTK